VIFITAASDMQTCSHAMRSGAFDYLIKPVFFQRLHASLERFMRFIHTVQQVKVVDQHALDRLFNLPAAESSPRRPRRALNPTRWSGLNAFSPIIPTARCR
jgi:two-component system response regulator CitB